MENLVPMYVCMYVKENQINGKKKNSFLESSLFFFLIFFLSFDAPMMCTILVSTYTS